MFFTGDSQTKNEIDAYLKFPNISPTADPLAVWRENVHLPRLKNSPKFFTQSPLKVFFQRLGTSRLKKEIA